MQKCYRGNHMAPGDEYKHKENFNPSRLKVLILLSCLLAVLCERDESGKVTYARLLKVFKMCKFYFY